MTWPAPPHTHFTHRLSESLEICCASCPNYGPLLIKISIDLDKLFPSYCRWKFELISQGIVNKVNNKENNVFKDGIGVKGLRFPSYCRRKLARKYWQFMFTLFTIPCDIISLEETLTSWAERNSHILGSLRQRRLLSLFI